MVPQKCQYWPKLGSVSNDRPPKSGTSQVLLIDLTRLFCQSIIKTKVVLIIFFIKYNIYFNFESSIFQSYHHSCLKNMTTTEVRGEHLNTSLVTSSCSSQ